MRTALLAAVSHDLRTPLASAKAAVTSLRSPDVVFTDDDRDELLATADESLDRLDRLVENLLDMSRLQAGALGVHAQPISVDEAIPRALDELGDAGQRRHGARPRRPARGARRPRPAGTDPGQRGRQRPAVQPSRTNRRCVTASEHAGMVEMRVIDHGPGIPAADRDRVFLPFQRLGDRDNDTGVGLGLALSRGLAEAWAAPSTRRTPPAAASP